MTLLEAGFARLGVRAGAVVVAAALMLTSGAMTSPAGAVPTGAAPDSVSRVVIAGSARVQTLKVTKTRIRPRPDGRARVEFRVNGAGAGGVRLQYLRKGRWKTWRTVTMAGDGWGRAVLPVRAKSAYWRVRPVPAQRDVQPLGPSPSVEPEPGPSLSGGVVVPRLPAPDPMVIPVDALNVLSFGAVGDGVTDDSAAIQRALSALQPGGTLVFPSGRVFAHSAVLKVAVAGSRLTGGGTLLAVNERASAVFVDANNVTVDHLAFVVKSTTQRWAEYEKQGLRILGVTGTRISDVVVDGAGAAGIYIAHASGFALTRVTVKNTRADAIHITNGSHDGTITDVMVSGTGDDGVAVVSLANGNPAVSNVVVTRATVLDQKWGRAFSVVGGSDITWRDIYAERSNAASLYIAAESEWGTQAVSRVLVDGATIVDANTNAAVDHGAVFIYNSQSTVNSDITLQNIRIDRTRDSASRQVSILGGQHARVLVKGVTITGGNSSVFGSNVPATSYSTTGWTYNGNPIADRIGW